MASQVSLPNMSALRPWLHARRGPSDLWTRSGRNFLVHDGVEQIGLDRPVGDWAYVLALLRERGITRAVQRRSALARRRNPLRKRILGYGPQDKVHVGKPAAAVLRGQATKVAGFVRGQVELRDHAGHGGDHAAELWHKEHVHHGG